VETSDYIAIFALLVSLISAGISLPISIRSWRFNVRIKSLELRTILLTSLHNALWKAESVLEDYTLCKNKALDAKKTEFFKKLTADEVMHSFIKKLRGHIQQVESASGYKAVNLYERSIGWIINASLQIDDLANKTAKLKTILLNELLEEKGKSKPLIN
jgi:hypothetical protein